MMHCRAVNPPLLQILRIDREGMTDDVITDGTWRHLCKKYSLAPLVTNLWWHKTCKKDVVGKLCIFEMTGSLLLQWHARVYEETLNVNFKIVETMQYILNLACEQAPCSQGTSIWNFIVWKSSLYWRNRKLLRLWLSGRSHTLIWSLEDMV